MWYPLKMPQSQSKPRFLVNHDPLPPRLSKRVADIMMVTLVLVVLFPLIGLLLLVLFIEYYLINEDDGSLFYFERRVSHGKEFDLIKFRTIRQDVYDKAFVEKGLEYLKALEKDPANFTRCGRFMLRFYLDELPQLYNVFKGDMSFVGPRPWAVAQHQKALEAGINTKNIVPCGLIGIVQSYKGVRDETPQMDIDYIFAYKNKSALGLLWFDLKILFRSVLVIFSGKGM